jgi:protocatechuate 3,4-dioxygenase alpha subunit
MAPRLPETPSQTAGPYLHIGLAPHAAGGDFYGGERWHVLAGPGAEGRRVRIEGTVYDGAGEPVRDALVEIWQANALGRHDHPDDTQDKPLDPAFRGFGRAASDSRPGCGGSRRSSPAPSRAATAGTWPRTSASPSSPAASTST